MNVKKRFTGFEMEASWRAGREVTVLFGPSGSGKTTLLRMIAGLERPDEGRISVGGRILFDEKTSLKPEERRVGLVFQDHALFPWLTVGQNIFFGLPHHERRVGNKWARTLVDVFGIGALLDKRPGHLSGGEAQRVALARALSPRPELLLLDEPFSALHGPLRTQLRKFIKDIQHEWSIPVILVTHDLTEAHLIGDHLVKIERGRVSYEGPVDGLVNHGSNPVMAAY
ncbi:MAG: ATP-binding cassette domain-containing protein [Mariprofundaceae bacterium]|nr:ATP-binding cassette domain-containing protein [Mariprofundaceae bacterium]